MKLPAFEQLVPNYPVGHDAENVKKDIGGNVDADWITNTCVIRISKAFNYAGHKKWQIPNASDDGLSTVSGKDRLQYAFRVQEFIDFLRDTYGSPQVIKSGNAISREPFRGFTGIIAWRVNGWTDATGHFTLWDGQRGLYEGDHTYFDFPTKRPDGGGPWLTKAELWRC
ncbi:MAG: hypothetical protein HZB28_12545 [Methylocystis sp.]|nr:hypothetical protein [Methylocystis sp.]